MKTIDIPELLTTLYHKKPNGAYVSMVTETVPKMNKTDNPFFGRVTKRSFTTVRLGVKNYEELINKLRAREGNEEVFEAKPRKWGARINNTPLVIHVKKGASNPSYYCEVQVEGTYHEPEYYLDGRFVDMIPLRDQILSFITEKSSNAEWQGLSEEKIIRDYALESIREIKMDGEVYVIEH